MSNVPSSRIRSMDFQVIDKVFGMEGGYVLDFSNRTFADFFREELGVDIDHPRWEVQGDSKGKRLRYYLKQADCKTALNTLHALWEYRTLCSATTDLEVLDEPLRKAYFRIVERLGGESPLSGSVETGHPGKRVDEAVASDLADRLLEISTLEPPQARGYAFEKFLGNLFDAYGMAARASFRLRGGQVDGSFMLGEQTYLLEAKWTNAKIGASALRDFNGKVEDKTSWSRGLIISQSGFSDDGLHSFGRGKSIVCMDGLDLHEILSRRLDLAEVIALKVRRAAETGVAHVPVRDLNIGPPK